MWLLLHTRTTYTLCSSSQSLLPPFTPKPALDSEIAGPTKLPNQFTSSSQQISYEETRPMMIQNLRDITNNLPPFKTHAHLIPRNRGKCIPARPDRIDSRVNRRQLGSWTRPHRCCASTLRATTAPSLVLLGIVSVHDRKSSLTSHSHSWK